jgi:O-antigen/teichoic acid export membrane protein
VLLPAEARNGVRLRTQLEGVQAAQRRREAWTPARPAPRLVGEGAAAPSSPELAANRRIDARPRPMLLTAAAVAAGLALLLLTAHRPATGCAVLAVGIPLTGGLARGAAVPLLRVSEALLLVAVAGLAVHVLARRRPLRFTGLDLAIAAFCLLTVLVPASVVVLERADAALDDWRTVVSPFQYLAVYLLFSRTVMGERDRRLVLQLTMAASLPMAAVAALQYSDLGGARALIDGLYPGPPRPSWDPVYRPTALLGHYSALGAYGLLNFTLAFALAAARHSGYRGWWLVTVMAANLGSLLLAETYAPIIALPVALVLAAAHARRVPWRHLLPLSAAAVAGAVLLLPTIGARLTEQQLTGPMSIGLGVPQTMQTRIDYWTGFFLPGYVRHGLWLGTGTLLPPEVPQPLAAAVDNGYLWMGFRAGLLGLALLALALGAIAAAGWAARRSDDPALRAVGATCLAAVVSVALLDLTSEYLTFTTVSQELWMLVGLLAAMLGAGQPLPEPAYVLLRPPARRPSPAAVRRLLPERAFIRSSAVVFGGFGVARLLGFLFSVAAARVLLPADYGRMAYALAIAGVAAVLLNAAPTGLARFLVRAEGDPVEQEAWWTNWLAVVGVLLAISLGAGLLGGAAAGLDGWMLVGLAANLIGMAALETYRELQRGLGRFGLQALHYVAANLLQLLAILLAARLGWRSPSLFVVAYGVASPLALLAIVAVRPLGLRLRQASLSRERMLDVLRFVRPLLVESVCYAVWFGGDVILVGRLLGPAQAGVYAAAKAVSSGFVLVPLVISFVYLPRVARLADRHLLGSLLRVLALTALVALPPAIAVIAVAQPLVRLLFGAGYAAAAAPLAVLVAGMAVYGFRGALAGLWVGLGHPVVAAVSTASAVIALLAFGLPLIPRWGLTGAATAFAAGAVSQVLVAAAVTVRALPRPRLRTERSFDENHDGGRAHGSPDVRARGGGGRAGGDALGPVRPG